MLSVGIEIDSKKTEAVNSCPRPLSHTDIQSFLGLVEYYWRFGEGIIIYYFSIDSPNPK